MTGFTRKYSYSILDEWIGWQVLSKKDPFESALVRKNPMLLSDPCKATRLAARATETTDSSTGT